MCKKLFGLPRLIGSVLLISFLLFTSACITVVPKTTTATTPSNTAFTTTTPSITTLSTTVPLTTTPTPTSSPTATLTTGSLTVHSNAQMAHIYLDSEDKGTILFNDITIDGILPGTYTVKIIGGFGAGDSSKKVTIVAGETTIVYIYQPGGSTNSSPAGNEVITPDSAALYGSLQVNSNAQMANIYVGGESGGTITGSTTINGILPGTYTVKITGGLGSPADNSKQVSIVTGKTTVLYLYEPLNGGSSSPSRNEIITPDSAALYGSLQINSNAQLGNVYVGGESGGDITGSTTVKGILPGTYTVKVTGTFGYKDWTGQVTISTGQTTVINVTLVQ